MPNPASDGLQRRRSRNLILDLAYDICASVPFILGATPSYLYSSRAPKAAAGMSLLWPLYVAAVIEFPAPGMRAWIITRFEWIGQTMGIKQAECVAQVLRTKKEITVWDRLETLRPDEELDDW